MRDATRVMGLILEQIYVPEYYYQQLFEYSYLNHYISSRYP